MNGNDNVVIYTEDKEAKRSILNFILSYLGIKVQVTENSIEIQGSVSNDIINNIITKVIMEEQMEVVTMKPNRDKQDVVKQQEIKREEETQSKEEKQEIGQKETKEVIQEVLEETKEEATVSTEQQKSTLKEQVYNFICEKKKVTNAQIKEKFQIGTSYTSVILKAFYDEGKIQKIGRGKWKLKRTAVTKKVVNKQIQMEENTQRNNEKVTLNNIEKEVYLFIKEKEHVEVKEIIQKFKLQQTQASRILQKLRRQDMIKNVSYGQWEVTQTGESQILALLENGWQMTEEEISLKTKIELEKVSETLKKLLKDKKIRKVGEEYKIKEDSFGVFKEEEYKILLDYIMSVSRFSISKIRSKYPEEFPKLSELIQKISPKYIREEKDAQDTYVVHTKGRILYFIMNHENATFTTIKSNFNLISSQDVSTAINIALREGELKKNGKGGYIVEKMI